MNLRFYFRRYAISIYSISSLLVCCRDIRVAADAGEGKENEVLRQRLEEANNKLQQVLSQQGLLDQQVRKGLVNTISLGHGKDQ